MKRTYRIQVEFEAVFDRKIGARGWAKRIRELCAKAAPAGWSVTRTAVHSRAVPKPAAPVPPDPQEAVRDATLARLQTIATDASRLVRSAPNPDVRRWPNRRCGPQFNERMNSGAHAHISTGTTWFEGRKIGCRRGLICIKDSELDRVARGEVDPVWLMLHEVAHLRFRTGHDHRGRRYQESLERLERDYALNVEAALGEEVGG